MHGPSGTGKTLSAKAVNTESGPAREPPSFLDQSSRFITLLIILYIFSRFRQKANENHIEGIQKTFLASRPWIE